MSAPAIPFQVGGAIRRGKIYVERAADEELPKALLDGEICYVLAPRQIGKSSLKVRAMEHLEKHGARVADADITVLGGQDTDEDAWYFSLADEILDQLDLDADLEAFWEKESRLTPVLRWGRFLRRVVLEKIEGLVVLFIDEIDSILSRPISSDDFFAAIRATYNQRARDPAYERLAFCILGVAAPMDLMSDQNRTPFNIARPILLGDFSHQETLRFAPALSTLCENPGAVLEEIFDWTEGHPFLTQTLCYALVEKCERIEQNPETVVRDLVRESFFQAGIALNINLETARDRLLRAGAKTPEMLTLYRRVRSGGDVDFKERSRIHQGLLLSGMVSAKSDGGRPLLRPRNRIFAETFDLEWVAEHEGKRLFAANLAHWLESGKQQDFLLSGAPLEQFRTWARGQNDLTPEEVGFLQSSLELAAENDQRRMRQVRLISGFFILTTLVSLALGIWAFRQEKIARKQREIANEQSEIAKKQSELAGTEAKRAAQQEEIANTEAKRAAQQEEIAKAEAERATRQKELAMQEARSAARQREIAMQEARRATEQETRASELAQELNKLSYQSDIRIGLLLHETRQIEHSMAYFARALRRMPGETKAHVKILTLLMHNDFKIPSSASDIFQSPITPESRTPESRTPDTVLEAASPAEATSSALGTLTPGSSMQCSNLKDALSIRKPCSPSRDLPQNAQRDAWACAFSPDSQRIAIAAKEPGASVVWDLETDKPFASLAHIGDVRNIVFSPTGKHLATLSTRGIPTVWNADSGIHFLSLSLDKAIERIAFSLDGDALITIQSGPGKDTEIVKIRPFPDIAQIESAPTGPQAAAIFGIPSIAELFYIPGDQITAPLASLAEAIGGYRLDELSRPVPLPVDERIHLLKSLRTASKAKAGLDSSWKIVRWYFDRLDARQADGAFDGSGKLCCRWKNGEAEPCEEQIGGIRR